MAQIHTWDSQGNEFLVEVPDNMVPPQGGGNGGQPQGQQQSQGQGGSQPLQRTKQQSDKQIDVLFDRRNVPPPVAKIFWALNHKLALIKVTNPDELRKLRLKIENLTRMAHLSNRVDEETITALDLELLEFDTGDLELARSIGFDDRPTQVELLSMQFIQQHLIQQNKAATQSAGGAMSSAINWVKRRF
jgi:hypothetical protein